MTKKLKNLIALNQNVKIYVPSTINVDQSFDTTKYVDDALVLLSKCFGGATSYHALGAWVSASGALIKERISICEAFCKEAQINEHIELIYDFCLQLKRDLKQEAIALEINGSLHFV